MSFMHVVNASRTSLTWLVSISGVHEVSIETKPLPGFER